MGFASRLFLVAAFLLPMFSRAGDAPSAVQAAIAPLVDIIDRERLQLPPNAQQGLSAELETERARLTVRYEEMKSELSSLSRRTLRRRARSIALDLRRLLTRRSQLETSSTREPSVQQELLVVNQQIRDMLETALIMPFIQPAARENRSDTFLWIYYTVAFLNLNTIGSSLANAHRTPDPTLHSLYVATAVTAAVNAILFGVVSPAISKGLISEIRDTAERGFKEGLREPGEGLGASINPGWTRKQIRTWTAQQLLAASRVCEAPLLVDATQPEFDEVEILASHGGETAKR